MKFKCTTFTVKDYTYFEGKKICSFHFCIFLLLKERIFSSEQRGRLRDFLFASQDYEAILKGFLRPGKQTGNHKVKQKKNRYPYTFRWLFVVNTKTWIKSQKFNISPRNLIDFLFLLFSTVYNAKLRDTLFKKSVFIRGDQKEFS